MKGSMLNDEFFSRLEALAFELRANLGGFFGGKHLVRTYGQTVEFADYREYMLGDDIRRIDWNLYSRFEKYFLKLFTDERQMHTQIFIDCSASMGKDAIVFPMANPTPEIMPDLAKKAGARIVGTGRSDFPNQINNVLAFPGIFRGALDCRASCINEEMKVATSHALASLISDEELNEENIIAPALDKRVAEVVAKAVIEAAHKTGVARI